MADFLSRFRARLEAMQEELAPEAGFDRRAYGYDDEEGAEDAAFEEEEESPWRRETDDDAPGAPPAAARAGGAEEGSETRSGTAGPGFGADGPQGHRPPTAPRSSLPEERTRAPNVRRAQRLRAQLRQPEPLRDLFLLREVIDRPLALRRRPRARRRPS